ncbi:MAG: 50S ribosomal protein L34e [Candidatus Woesearchaeota archaeon]
MVSGKHKSGSVRKVFVKTPGGQTKTVYKLRKPSRATCPVTGEKLQGIPHVRPTELRNTPVSKRKPSRAYGGNLSSKAARRAIIQKARQ